MTKTSTAWMSLPWGVRLVIYCALVWLAFTVLIVAGGWRFLVLWMLG